EDRDCETHSASTTGMLVQSDRTQRIGIETTAEVVGQLRKPLFAGQRNILVSSAPLSVKHRQLGSLADRGSSEALNFVSERQCQIQVGHFERRLEAIPHKKPEAVGCSRLPGPGLLQFVAAAAGLKPGSHKIDLWHFAAI